MRVGSASVWKSCVCMFVYIYNCAYKHCQAPRRGGMNAIVGWSNRRTMFWMYCRYTEVIAVSRVVFILPTIRHDRLANTSDPVDQ
jgi:hypothetical protein